MLCLLLIDSFEWSLNGVWFSCFQKLRANASPYARTKQPSKSVKHEKLGKSNSDWSWLDRWMAAKPWENRLMEEMTPEMTPFSRKGEDFSYSSSGQDSVEVRKNNLTTRISARPPSENHLSRSSSAPSSESLYDETSRSTSSSSASPTLVFSNSVRVENVKRTSMRKPSYMNLTKATKAKQRACKVSSSPDMQRYMMEELQFHKLSMTFSNGDTRSSAGSNPSGNLSKDLYPPMPRCRYEGVRSRRQ